MNKQTMAFLLFAWLAGASHLSAQQEILSLSLHEAQQYALEYNRLVKNAGLSVNAAQEDLWDAISMGLPQVNASLDYSNFLGASIEIAFAEGAPPTKIPFKPTSNFAVNVGQLIFSGTYIVGLQTARIYRDLAESNYEKTEMDIRQQVAGAYYTVLVAERSHEIILQNLDNIRDLQVKTRAMYAAGMAEVTDVDQIAVQVTVMENAAKTAERQIELSCNMLRLQLGVDAETGIVLSETMDGILLGIDFEGTLEEEFEINRNIDYQMMNTQQLLSDKQISMARMTCLPTVSGFYSRTGKILKPDFDMTPPNVVGLQMNIPIFSSGSRKSKLDKAKINYETTLNNKEFLTDQLLIQEKQLRFNLSSGMEQYESRKKNLEVARRVFDNINLKYQQGLVSSLDLITANNNYLQAETGSINAWMELLNAQLALDKLLTEL